MDGKMTDPPIDIAHHLGAKAKRLEDVIASLRDLQIVEASEYAPVSYIHRLRRCVEALDDAVSELEILQGER